MAKKGHSKSDNNSNSKVTRNKLANKRKLDSNKLKVRKIVRRNPNSKRDFKSKPKTLKYSNIKTKKEKTNIEEEDNRIEYHENDNKLFNDTGFYSVKKEEELVSNNEWSNEADENAVNLFNLLNEKMNVADDSEIDPRAVEGFQELGKILSTWTSGKLPKLFGVLPNLEQWKEYIRFTNPKMWTPHAMYEAVYLFSSNFNNTLVEQFYKEFFVPALRENIKKHEKLNVYLYNALKRSLFKPVGFFKGIIFPLAENLTIKEANIVGSILKKCSIPIAHSANAIMKLVEHNGLNRVSQGHFFFIKLLLSKKYALPMIVKDSIVKFLDELSANIAKSKINSKNFNENNSILPVCFHQVLLSVCQYYKFDLNDKDKEIIKQICRSYPHHIITNLVYKELATKKIS